MVVGAVLRINVGGTRDAVDTDGIPSRRDSLGVPCGEIPVSGDILATRLASFRRGGRVAEPRAAIGKPLDAREASALGLVTATPDDIDWADEIRIALEERAAMSPDALTGMEANLRFAGPESAETKVFGRLSAWQNWIFIRPNSTGERGALALYGKPERPQFDWRRT